jgi:hypothetical protein
MWRVGTAVLLLLGLPTAAVGALIGIGVAIPALGLNSHGRNSVEVTLAAAGVATVIYLFGAVFEILGGRLIAEHQARPIKSSLPPLAASAWLATVLALVPAIRYGSWQLMAESLSLVGLVVGPLWAGFLSIWIGFQARPSSR